MALKIRKKRVPTSQFKKRLPVEDRDLLPPEIDIPEPPIYERDGEPGDAQLRDEQQVTRVELLMTKGIRNKRQLMALLDINDGRTMDRYIKRVHARWEMYGTTQEHARHRGEGLNRLDLIESEIWSKLTNLDQKASPQIALNYLSTVLNVQKQRNEMLGLTPKVIAHIGSGEDGSIVFSREAAQHDRLSMVAQRMMQLIEERTAEPKTIEHDDES
jgi:hypothetical protein